MITNLQNGYKLVLLGDVSASQGEAVLLQQDTSGGYSVVVDVPSTGWVKETTNGIVVIRLADAIRSRITDDISDGFYGFTEYDGRVQQVRYYLDTNEPMMFMNKATMTLF